MLHEFLTENRSELAARCRSKVATRSASAVVGPESEYGVPVLIEQLVDMLRDEQLGTRTSKPTLKIVSIEDTAVKHGFALLRRGFTIAQVVHDYGDLCQALTELAREKDEPISVTEFHTFNQCLDIAIAGAVAEFGRQRDHVVSTGDEGLNARLGALAHQQRNLLNTAVLAFTAIEGGHGALTGLTGAVLERSLQGIRSLIDRSLADVRLGAEFQALLAVTPLDHFLKEIEIAAQADANSRSLRFVVMLEPGLSVTVDREMLSSALANVLQNAFKFTPTGGYVSLAARKLDGRVLIEVADECGGLPPGRAEELLLPFEPRSDDVGLGLSVSRRSVDACGGILRVANLPGVGCVFTIDLASS